MTFPTAATRTLVFLSTCVFLAMASCADEANEPASDDAGSDATQAQTSDEQAMAPLDFESAEPAEEHVATSTKRGTIAALPPLSVESFLPRADVQEFIPDTPLDIAPLPGQRVGADYNALRYSPREANAFGIALQVWRTDTPEAARERVETMREQFLNTAELSESSHSDAAFTSERAGIRTIVFPSAERSYAFALSCGLDHCRNWRPLIKLSETIASRQ
ncbi:hypothetical protein DL240_11505 [Lujinxingia litoralis]|uniref:SPOR domain-containing protein n=1 Tax=Lujinxingia litoralis TaxID=2211119 RepID=A0A328C7T0_9DELT|nr:hypothetical protein [Lujinxingia litoralis]RAL22464.1 hypothetical protein DL240_11505 [Lujinxingia litoralis]